MLWWLFQVVAAMSILEPPRDILFCWVQPTSQCAAYLGCSGASCLVTSRGMLLLAALLFLWGSWVQEPGRMVKLVVPERQRSAAQMHRVGTPHGLPACLPAAWCRLHCFSRCVCVLSAGQALGRQALADLAQAKSDMPARLRIARRSMYAASFCLQVQACATTLWPLDIVCSLLGPLCAQQAAAEVPTARTSATAAESSAPAFCPAISECQQPNTRSSLSEHQNRSPGRRATPSVNASQGRLGCLLQTLGDAYLFWPSLWSAGTGPRFSMFWAVQAAWESMFRIVSVPAARCPLQLLFATAPALVALAPLRCHIFSPFDSLDCD